MNREGIVESRSYLDADELPFTEAELARALAILGDAREAREAAGALAAVVANGGDVAWSVSDETFAALALLSDDLRERVDAYMRARWEAMRATLLHASGRAPEEAGWENAKRDADDEIRACVRTWEEGCATLATWSRRRQAGETVETEPPPWPDAEPRAG